MRHTYNFFLFSLFILVVYFQSCTKTEYEYEKRPYTDIKQFVIIGSDGDSAKCLIIKDTITVYWNPDITLPANVTPSIVIDEKATITPASGESISFKDNTTYTVTAEDGTTKIYTLKIVLNLPTPVLSGVQPASATWITNSFLNIYGEYLLANADTSDLSAYMQRVSDGFEIPLELDRNRITNYSLIAVLPAFSAEQDTGLHKVFVKSKNRIAESIDVQFNTPVISHANPVSNMVQEGQPIHSGDSLTINYSLSDVYDGKIAGYYHARNVDHILFYVAPSYEWVTIPKENIAYTDNTVTFKLPDVDKYIGQNIVQYRFIYNSVPAASATLSTYFLRGFITNNTPIEAK